MEETILSLAQSLCGAEDQRLPYLEALCRAAQERWSRRLKSGVSQEECAEAMECASALWAAADFLESDGQGVSSFTAGELTIHERTGEDRSAMCQGMRRAAQRLMAPYAQMEDFCFREVRG